MHAQRQRIESLADVEAMPDPHRLVLFGYVRSRSAFQSHLAMLLGPASLLIALYLLAYGAAQHFDAAFLANLVLGLQILIPFVLAGFLAFFGLHGIEAFGATVRRSLLLPICSTLRHAGRNWPAAGS